MRLWLKTEERRPSPPPFPTNDSTALMIGCGLWLLALVAALVAPSFGVVISTPALSTIVIGVLLGTVGLVYLRIRH